jgi:hypothetical protein
MKGLLGAQEKNGLGPGRKTPSALGGNRGGPEKGGKGYMMGMEGSLEKERIGRGRK